MTMMTYCNITLLNYINNIYLFCLVPVFSYCYYTSVVSYLSLSYMRSALRIKKKNCNVKEIKINNHLY